MKKFLLFSFLIISPFVAGGASWLFVPGSSAAFTPLSISGCQLWLDGSDATTINAGSPVDGDKVSSWTDKSGHSNSASQATSGFQPVYHTGIVNSKSAVLFNTGSGTYMTMPNTNFMPTGGGFTVILVIRPTSIGSENLMFGSWSTSGTTLTGTIDYLAGQGYMRIDQNAAFAGTSFSGSGLLANNNYKMQLFNSSGTGTATNNSLRYNGSVITGTAEGTTGHLNSNISCIGGDNGDAGSTLTGYILEAIAYNTALNSTQQGQIDSYILGKWGF